VILRKNLYCSDSVMPLPLPAAVAFPFFFFLPCGTRWWRPEQCCIKYIFLSFHHDSLVGVGHTDNEINTVVNITFSDLSTTTGSIFFGRLAYRQSKSARRHYYLEEAMTVHPSTAPASRALKAVFKNSTVCRTSKTGAATLPPRRTRDRERTERTCQAKETLSGSYVSRGPNCARAPT